MKKASLSLLLAAGVLAGPGAAGQGAFIFGNRPSAIGGVGAPVGFLGFYHPGFSHIGAIERVPGTDFLAQLVVNGVPRPDTITRFGAGGAAGYIPNSMVVLDGHAPGTTVSVQLAAWYAGLGADINSALATGWGGATLSNPVNVLLKDPADMPLNSMIGLQPFMISGIFPEPDIASLAMLGLAVFALCRRA